MMREIKKYIIYMIFIIDIIIESENDYFRDLFFPVV